MRFRSVLVALVLGLTVSACGRGYDINELERIPSPDGSADAVIALHDPRGGLGATVPFYWAVYLVCNGCKAEENALFVAGKVIELKVRWDHPRQLHIAAFNARPFEQKDFVTFQRQKIVRVEYAIDNQFYEQEYIERAALAQGRSLPLQVLAPK
jgi:hypothetical protein